jgi:DNA-binding transcriptional ArsR family regulator
MNNLESMAELFAMLGEPTRLKIVTELAREERCVHELADTLGLSLSAISHQLRLLKATRVVKFRKAGKHVFYRLDDDHIKQILQVASEHVDENRTTAL